MSITSRYSSIFLLLLFFFLWETCLGTTTVSTLECLGFLMRWHTQPSNWYTVHIPIECGELLHAYSILIWMALIVRQLGVPCYFLSLIATAAAHLQLFFPCGIFCQHSYFFTTHKKKENIKSLKMLPCVVVFCGFPPGGERDILKQIFGKNFVLYRMSKVCIIYTTST